MKYRILYTTRARTDLHRFPKKTAQRMIRAIHGLHGDLNTQIKLVQGGATDHPVYIFRIGSYFRAILSLHDTVLIIHALGIEDRDRQIVMFEPGGCIVPGGSP